MFTKLRNKFKTVDEIHLTLLEIIALTFLFYLKDVFRGVDLSTLTRLSLTVVIVVIGSILFKRWNGHYDEN